MIDPILTDDVVIVRIDHVHTFYVHDDDDGLCLCKSWSSLVEGDEDSYGFKW